MCLFLHMFIWKWDFYKIKSTPTFAELLLTFHDVSRIWVSIFLLYCFSLIRDSFWSASVSRSPDTDIVRVGRAQPGLGASRFTTRNSDDVPGPAPLTLETGTFLRLLGCGDQGAKTPPCCPLRSKTWPINNNRSKKPETINHRQRHYPKPETSSGDVM